MNKTRYRFDWENGHTKQKTLSRSFETLDEAKGFSKGKNVVDIYVSHGKYRVEWVKTIDNNGKD